MLPATLVLAAMLLGARSANVNRHMRLLGSLDNSIDNAVPSNQSIKLLAITRRPSELIAHPPGTTVEITCEAYGAPAPSIHWYKNDAPVYEHGLESSELIDTNPTSLARLVSTLLIPNTPTEDRYMCLVKSGNRVASAATTVYRADGSTEVTERSKLHPLAPRILVSYKAYVDHIGNNVVLPCHARGHPKPHIVWTHRANGDINSTTVKSSPRFKVLRSGELVISPLHWSDMGEFTCHATNAFGSHRAATFVYPAKAG